MSDWAIHGCVTWSHDKISNLITLFKTELLWYNDRINRNCLSLCVFTFFQMQNLCCLFVYTSVFKKMQEMWKCVWWAREQSSQSSDPKYLENTYQGKYHGDKIRIQFARTKSFSFLWQLYTSVTNISVTDLQYSTALSRCI